MKSSIGMMVVIAAVLAAAGCSSKAGDSGDTDTSQLDISICAPENGPFSTEITNAYLPFQVGAVNVLEGLEGGTEQIKLRFTVLDETQDVDGVTTRVVEELVWEGDSETVTGTQRLYVVQASDGTVCFYGTETTQGEGTEEEWMAGVNDALPAILMPGDPAVGQVFEVVHAPPDDVEPVEITAMGDTVETDAGVFTDTVTTAAEEAGGVTLKSYAAGVGLVDDDGVKLLSSTYL